MAIAMCGTCNVILHHIIITCSIWYQTVLNEFSNNSQKLQKITSPPSIVILLINSPEIGFAQSTWVEHIFASYSFPKQLYCHFPGMEDYRKNAV